MTVYYVRPTNGSNAAAGTSFGAAWQTFQHAINTVVSGDVIHLCAESDESVTAKVDFNGTWAYGSILAASGVDGSVDGTHRYTIKATAALGANGLITAASGSWRGSIQGVIFDANGNADNCWKETADCVGNLTFRLCSFLNPDGDSMLRGQAGSDTTFHGCTFSGTGGSYCFYPRTGNRASIQAYYTHFDKAVRFEAGGSNPRFSRCVFQGTLYMDANPGIISKCLFYGMSGSAISASNGGSDETKVVGCTFYNVGSHAVSLGANDDGWDFYDNTFSDVTGYAISVGDTASIGTLKNNHYHSCSSGFTNATTTHRDPDSLTGDPLFVAPGSGDFTPDTGSPLIGAGLDGDDIGAICHAAGGGGNSVPYGVRQVGSHGRVWSL